MKRRDTGKPFRVVGAAREKALAETVSKIMQMEKSIWMGTRKESERHKGPGAACNKSRVRFQSKKGSFDLILKWMGREWSPVRVGLLSLLCPGEKAGSCLVPSLKSGELSGSVSALQEAEGSMRSIAEGLTD